MVTRARFQAKVLSFSDCDCILAMVFSLLNMT